MPLIPFPNVANSPGVPAIPRIAGASGIVQSIKGIANGVLWASMRSGTNWGIYTKEGKALADPSKLSGVVGSVAGTLGIGPTLSTVSFDYGKEMRISDFPIEKGQFASYNKVEIPSNPTVVLGFTGSEQERGTFLAAISKATRSTEILTIVTPEVHYVNQTIESYSFRRSAEHGATLLIVEVRLKQVRQVSSAYTKSGGQAGAAKSNNASAPVKSGVVQALPSASSVIGSVANKVPGGSKLLSVVK